MLPRILNFYAQNFGSTCAKFSHRCTKSGRRKKSKFSPLMRTSIMMQDGLKIHEAPLIVQKTRDVNDLICCRQGKPSAADDKKRENTKNSEDGRKEIHIETDEGTAVLFSSEIDIERSQRGDKAVKDDKRNFAKGPIIENMITDEINCRVALEALKEIMRFEDDDGGGGGSKRLSRERNVENQEILTSSNGRERVLDQLMDMIVKTRDNEMIIDGLALLGKDRVSSSKNLHKDRLCDEALIRATKGQFSIGQLIELVKVLSAYGDATYREVLDNLWVGIKARQGEIDDKNLVPLFRILPLFRESRRIVETILDRKLSINWWKLSGSQMSEILEVTSNNRSTINASIYGRKWSKLHMNTAQESELFDFMKTASKLTFSEKESLEKSLARYMRDKGLATKDPALLALVMNYCGKNRIRNSQIFNTCAEYLAKNSMDIPASLLAPIFVPFGYLNFQPPDSQQNLKTFQTTLETKFSCLATNDALNIMLALIYLKQTPLNLFDQIFTTNFLEKLHVNRDAKSIAYLRGKLCFLDRAMSIENDRYSCRMSPEIHWEKKILMRSRLKRVTDLLFGPLAKIVGGEDKLSRAVMIGHLSMFDLYTLDILIHPRSSNTSIFSLRDSNDTKKTALLINLPEHYCRNTSSLIGPQEMRIRHLKKLGFRVVALNYMAILTLRNSPQEMTDYITRNLQLAD